MKSSHAAVAHRILGGHCIVCWGHGISLDSFVFGPDKDFGTFSAAWSPSPINTTHQELSTVCNTVCSLFVGPWQPSGAPYASDAATQEMTWAPRQQDIWAPRQQDMTMAHPQIGATPESSVPARDNLDVFVHENVLGFDVHSLDVQKGIMPQMLGCLEQTFRLSGCGHLG